MRLEGTCRLALQKVRQCADRLVLQATKGLRWETQSQLRPLAMLTIR